MIVTGAGRRPLVDVAELLDFREVLFFLVWRDLKVRYRQTYLGIVWAVLHPIIAMGVFTIVFGTLVGVPSGGVPYPLFALCGLVPWNFFSRATAAMTSSLVSNQEMVTRVYLPRIVIPASAMLSALVDTALGFIILLAALAFYATLPPVQIVLLPLFILVMVGAVLGLGLALAAANVRFRDVNYVVPFGLQVLLFLTPVVYPSNLVPETWRMVYSLNPMVGALEGIRWCVLGIPFDAVMIFISSLSSAALLVAGLTCFARTERAFADLI